MYLEKAITIKNIVLGTLITWINYIFFPNETFKMAITAWLIAVVIDLLTKCYAISRNHRDEESHAKGFFKVIKFFFKGYYNATYHKALNSSTLWEKTWKKFMQFGLVLIMLSALHRLGFAKDAVELFTSIVFLVAFIREWQSVFENLQEANHDVKWILDLISKVKKMITKPLE